MAAAMSWLMVGGSPSALSTRSRYFSLTISTCLPGTEKAVDTRLERSSMAKQAAWESGRLKASLPAGSSALATSTVLPGSIMPMERRKSL